MHNIVTPELPLTVLTARNEFIEEQRRQQEQEELARQEKLATTTISTPNKKVSSASNLETDFSYFIRQV